MVGWAFPDPQLGPNSPGKFLLNGVLFDEIRYPSVREDVEEKLWQRKNSRYSGYKCSATLPAGRVYPNGVLELTYVNPGPPRSIPAQQSWFQFDPALQLPFSGESRRYRVIANNDLDSFALSGFTDFKRLDAAAAALSGKSFAGFPRILDFGCGCGRLARYTSRLPQIALSGCDIDAANAHWCANNLSGSFAPTNSTRPRHFPIRVSI
jgi:hypothetical protein